MCGTKGNPKKRLLHLNELNDEQVTGDDIVYDPVIKLVSSIFLSYETN